MDKLALIKQKYGYVSKAENKNDSKQIAQKENTPIKRAQSQRKESSISVPKMSAERANHAFNTSNTKLLAQFCPPLPTKTQQKHHPPNSTREPLKQVKSDQNQKQDSRESFVKSYEKTYDLLKNYRNRIMIDSRKEHNLSQKTMILNQSKNGKEQKEKKMQQSNLNEMGQKQSLVASQASQRMQKRAYPKRCSPLEGIDLKGSCNVYAEIDNISRLQSRIQQLIGERSVR